MLRSEQLHGLQGGGALPRGEQGGGYQQTGREREITDFSEAGLFLEGNREEGINRQVERL